MLRQDLARPLQGRADDLADIVQGQVGQDGAGLEPGHVEQVGDEPVEALGFINDSPDQLGLGLIVQGRGEVPQARWPSREWRPAAS